MKLIDALFCDDIRREANNKVSLMGLYNDRMVIRLEDSINTKWPLLVNLSTLLRFSREKIETSFIQFIFQYLLNEKIIVKIQGKINLDNINKIFTIALTGNAIPLEPGNLGFSIKIFDDNHIYLTETNKSALKIMKV